MSRPIHASPTTPPTAHPHAQSWVRQVASLTRPRAVHWCDGSVAEYDRLCQELVEAGTLERLSGATAPTRTWRARTRATSRALKIGRSSAQLARRGWSHKQPSRPSANARNADRPVPRRDAGSHDVRVSFSMGPLGSDKSYIGVQLTDSAYVGVSMRVMTRMGQPVRDALGIDGEFVRCLHSVGMPLSEGVEHSLWPCNAEEKYIVYENSRVLAWVFRRCDQDATAVPTPIGLVPRHDDRDLTGAELPQIRKHLAQFGERLPAELHAQLTRTELELSPAQT
jgi:phosphoenolpyruvate carboxykinase (GTP)